MAARGCAAIGTHVAIATLHAWLRAGSMPSHTTALQARLPNRRASLMTWIVIDQAAC